MISAAIGATSMIAKISTCRATILRQALAVSGTYPAVNRQITIVAEDTGLDYGRSVYFHLSDGRVEVRSLKKGDRVL